MTWKPIETAPSDNRSILLRRPGIYSPVVAWLNSKLGYIAFELPDDRFILINDATEWHPLPDESNKDSNNG